MEWQNVSEDELRERYSLPNKLELGGEMDHLAVGYMAQLDGWFIEDKRSGRWYAGLATFADTIAEVWFWHTNEELQKRAAGIAGLN